jgi:hypothetical protein
MKWKVKNLSDDDKVLLLDGEAIFCFVVGKIFSLSGELGV